MEVKDKRATREEGVPFEELSIGQVYEDRDGVLCIKTGNGDFENNCIALSGKEWESFRENPTNKVTPLTATLEIEG